MDKIACETVFVVWCRGLLYCGVVVVVVVVVVVGCLCVCACYLLVVGQSS